FFGSKVAPKYTREFGWAIAQHGAHEAWFVTTALFSDQARDDVSLLTSRDALKLIDGPPLLAYVHDHWDALPARWQWRLTECMLERDHQRAAT
ncbi:MAG TPA: restriction endonuclease, partial [Ktedonobacteraceae bacterium]|nr:restriction endonuclease [Ktedonobacteraceae bacterium]